MNITTCRGVLKDLHSRQRLDHQEVEGRHQKVMDKMESQSEIFKHIRSGINANWTLEEIRSGGAHGIDGKVDKNGGSLLATINKNIATLVELQPEVSAGLATEIRSIMETTGDKVASFLKRIPRPKHLHFEASYPLPIWRQCQN